MSVKKALLYFVKYPEPGKVKTRLANSIGHEKAAEAYKELAESNYRKLLTLAEEGVDVVVVFDPYEKSIEVEQWLPDACHYVVQQGSDLGERLLCAFLNAFEADFKHAVAFGSDTLLPNVQTVKDAFRALERKGAVLGPAFDGGYYLIGLSRKPESVFHDIEWSTPSVFETTKRRLERDQFSYEILETLKDLDDERDLEHAKEYL